ncbi:hypothetical protein ED312_23115 [Sinomicrobium pectinilyticum]|uniref:Uncharacterized protein n=1 Tax=Sinomicrobium pectinilyticum TaxID=1084421 RepID=A0A3N0CZ61_SINP1|nr:hypothetical protein ED312_23115 [Sinomicrobium pectinilyticum]
MNNKMRYYIKIRLIAVLKKILIIAFVGATGLCVYFIVFKRFSESVPFFLFILYLFFLNKFLLRNLSLFLLIEKMFIWINQKLLYLLNLLRV